MSEEFYSRKDLQSTINLDDKALILRNEEDPGNGGLIPLYRLCQNNHSQISTSCLSEL